MVSLGTGRLSRPLAHRIATLAATVVLLQASAAAQSRDNLLLVINERSPESIQIGEHYASTRGLTDPHIVRIKTVTTDSVERTELNQNILAPLASWISRYSLQDTTLYIVLTKGVPLRVAGTEGQTGTVASVDSELTLLYRRLLGVPSPLQGWVPNPYFLSGRPIAAAKPLTRFSSDIYLVTRLDGFTVADALKIVDRGSAPSRDGQYVLDQKATLIDRGGDAWLKEAAVRLRASGGSVVLESTRAIAAADGPVMGYFSWGSNDPANQRRRSGLQFAAGAIGGTFVSTDGRTFAEPPAEWTPSAPDGKGPIFGGSFQSLAGDLIRDGITGVSGHVAEPFLSAVVRPQILFPAYRAGFNLAESFYLAMPYLSWQTVIVGDPLCAPFPRKALTPADIAKGIDPETEMPGLFAERRLALMSRGGLNPDALKLTLKAEVEAGRGNQATVESLLVRATEIEPRLIGAHLLLARAYEARNQGPLAIERYRRVLAVAPRNVLALNNLAYALATSRKSAKDALPLATLAFSISQEPYIADTLGWIHHLLGNDRQAAPLLERAAAASPASAPVLLHAAIVHAALNDAAKARAELATALTLDARLADDADVKALRARVGN